MKKIRIDSPTFWLWEGTTLRAGPSTLHGVVRHWCPGMHVTTDDRHDGDRVSVDNYSDAIVDRLAVITQIGSTAAASDPAVDYLRKLGDFLTRMVNCPPGPIGDRIADLLGDEGMTKMVELAQHIDAAVAVTRGDEAEIVPFPGESCSPENGKPDEGEPVIMGEVIEWKPRSPR